MSNRALSSEPARTAIEPEHLLDSLLRSAQQLLPCDVGVLALWDAEAKALVPFYAGLPDDDQDRQQFLKQPAVILPGEGIVGYVAETREPLNVQDVRTDKRYRELDASIRSELAVPIVRDGQFLGVLDVESRQVAVYTDNHVNALKALAEQAAFIIETSRLYNRLRNNYVELQDAHSDMMLRNEISRLSTDDLEIAPLIEQICELFGKYSNSDACRVLLWDYDRQSPGMFAEWKHESIDYSLEHALTYDRLIELLVDNEKTLVMNNVRQMDASLIDNADHPPSALLALPLAARRRVIGGVILMRFGEQPYTTQNIQRMQSSLDQIALSIDNRQLLHETRARLRESQSLLKLSEVTTKSLEFDDTIRELLELTQTMLQVEAVTILTHDRQDNVLIPIGSGFGFAESLQSVRVATTDMRSQCAIAFNMGHPQYVNSIDRLNGQEAELALASDLKNWLVAPLRVQDNPLGVIVVGNAAQTITSDTARRLTAIGSQVASVLRHFDYVSRLRLFRALSESSRRVSSELVSEQVLIAACQTLVDAIDGIDHAGMIINDNAPEDALMVAEFPSTGAVGTRIKLQGYPVYEQMLETGEPVVINDIASAGDLLGPNYTVVKHMGIQSLMVVPLIAQNTFLGSIGLDSKSALHNFSEAEIEFAGAMAGQIAISIYNARLFEQLGTRTRELEDANRLKSEFLAKISHELRTPMNSILGFSEIVLSGLYGDLNEKQADRLTRINSSGKSLLALIDDLLDLSKIEAGRMDLTIGGVDLEAQIKQCVQSLEPQATSKALALQLEIPGDLPMARGDSLRVQQVIKNLLSNAIKFTEGGSVTVQTTLTEKGMIRVGVIDTGIGIDANHLEIIFDEFRQADGSTTRRFGGTGLGLAISRYLVEMMDGKIWVESTPGEGSAFYFTLPLMAEPATQ